MNITSIMPQDRTSRNAEPASGRTAAPIAAGSYDHDHAVGGNDHEHGHLHDHDHDHDHAHGPAMPARLPFSLVRMSLVGRLAIAAGVAALLWGATLWAVTPIGG